MVHEVMVGLTIPFMLMSNWVVPFDINLNNEKWYIIDEKILYKAETDKFCKYQFIIGKSC